MQASFRPNRHYLLSRNTMIRCGQSTAIRTDRPGLIGCPIAQDVWSDDGTTLLVRKGAMAKGEQRDAVIQGQGVIGAIWDEIDDGDVHDSAELAGDRSARCRRYSGLRRRAFLACASRAR